MSDPTAWFPWITIATFVLGLTVGTLAVFSPAWVWLRRQILTTAAVCLAGFGAVLMTMSIWQSVRVEGPGGFKAVFEKLASIEALSELQARGLELELASVGTMSPSRLRSVVTGLTPSLRGIDLRKRLSALGLRRREELGVDYDEAIRLLSEAGYDPEVIDVFSSESNVMQYGEIPSASPLAAIEAYRETLSTFPRDQFPLEWAEAQARLGRTLQNTGVQNAARLQEAIDAYNAAISEPALENQAYAWATVHSNLGKALLDLAELSNNDESLIEQAIASLKVAQAAFSGQEQSQFEGAIADSLIAEANARLGTGGTINSP